MLVKKFDYLVYGSLLAMLMAFSMQSKADSYMRIVNNSNKPLQAVFQAGGCARTMTDWNGDTQYTVCNDFVVEPHSENRYTFGSFVFDRSAKVMVQGGERVGYCNTMDSASLVFWDDNSVYSGIRFVTNCD